MKVLPDHIVDRFIGASGMAIHPFPLEQLTPVTESLRIRIWLLHL